MEPGQSIPFALDNDSLKVRADLNGSAYVAVLDTGCSFPLLIPQPLAEVLHLPVGEAVAIGGAAGQDAGYYTTVELAIGPFTQQVQAVVDDGARDILIGLPVIQQLAPRVLFDFESKQMLLAESASATGHALAAVLAHLSELWSRSDAEGKRLAHATADGIRRLFASAGYGALVHTDAGYPGLQLPDGRVI